MTCTLLRRLCGVLALAFLPLAALAGNLPPGLSGAWYNPAQSGHGLSIVVHSSEHALVFWYTGDPAGAPLLLYTEARFDGSVLRGDARDSRGIRFGEFDPASHRLTRWGGIELELQSCDRLVLRYNADGPAGGPTYGNGAIEMRKLAGVDGVPCTDTLPTVGLFKGMLQVDGHAAEPFQALFSADGTVYFSINRGLRTHGAVLAGRVIAPQTDGRLALGLTAHREPSSYHLPRTVAYDVPTDAVALITAQLQIDARLRGYAGTLSEKPGQLPAAQFTLVPTGNDSAPTAYRRDVPVTALAGQYRYFDNFLNFNLRSLTVAANGQFEGFDRYFGGPTCRYHGRLNKPVPYGAWGSPITPSIEFSVLLTLSDCGERNGDYAGRAWVDAFDAGGAPASLHMATVRDSQPQLGFQFGAARSP